MNWRMLLVVGVLAIANVVQAFGRMEDGDIIAGQMDAIAALKSADATLKAADDKLEATVSRVKSACGL